MLYIWSVVLYLSFGFISITLISDWMASEFFDTLGGKAVDLAKIASNAYHITNQEVAELRRMDFRESLDHPASRRFSELFGGEDYGDDFICAYIAVRLESEDVKYRVTGENAAYFGAAPGTPLNYMWLVETVINRTPGEIISEDPAYYDDDGRYTIVRSEDVQPFDEKAQTYLVKKDEYGDAVTGFVPVYTAEGGFAGMLGVDISFERLKRRANFVGLSFMLIFLLPTVILSVIYLVIYFRNRNEARIESNTDPLTSLRNRRFLSDFMPLVLKEHYRSQNNLSVIMLDIDFFKRYNDTYGHQMGDSVLVKIGQAITSVLRRENDVACRYGGEEFLVILKHTALDGAIMVAEKIKNAIDSLAIEHSDSDVAGIVTISQGICSAIPLSYDKKNEEMFISYADKALYQAKNNGRNSYVVYSY